MLNVAEAWLAGIVTRDGIESCRLRGAQTTRQWTVVHERARDCANGSRTAAAFGDGRIPRRSMTRPVSLSVTVTVAETVL